MPAQSQQLLSKDQQNLSERNLSNQSEGSLSKDQQNLPEETLAVQSEALLSEDQQNLTEGSLTVQREESLSKDPQNLSEGILAVHSEWSLSKDQQSLPEGTLTTQSEASLSKDSQNLPEGSPAVHTEGSLSKDSQNLLEGNLTAQNEESLSKDQQNLSEGSPAAHGGQSLPGKQQDSVLRGSGPDVMDMEPLASCDSQETPLLGGVGASCQDAGRQELDSSHGHSFHLWAQSAEPEHQAAEQWTGPGSPCRPWAERDELRTYLMKESLSGQQLPPNGRSGWAAWPLCDPGGAEQRCWRVGSSSACYALATDLPGKPETSDSPQSRCLSKLPLGEWAASTSSRLRARTPLPPLQASMVPEPSEREMLLLTGACFHLPENLAPGAHLNMSPFKEPPLNIQVTSTPVREDSLPTPRDATQVPEILEGIFSDSCYHRDGSELSAYLGQAGRHRDRC